MLESYNKFLQELNDFLLKICAIRDPKRLKYSEEQHRKLLEDLLTEIWFNLDIEVSPTPPSGLMKQFKNEKIQTLSLRELKQRRGNLVEFLRRYYRDLAIADPKDQVHYQYWPVIIRTYNPTMVFLETIIKGDEFSGPAEILRESLLNIFLRLSAYPKGSLVPLRDLLDKLTPSPSTSSSPQTIVQFPDVSVNLNWKLVNEGMFFLLKMQGISFPTPYHIHLSAFEK